MVAQRGAGVEARKAKAGARQRPQRRVRPRRRHRRQRKLSFKEKHALETLPGHHEEARVRDRDARTASSPIRRYSRAIAKGFDADIKRLAACARELAQAEEQWLELEMKREELEGA